MKSSTKVLVIAVVLLVSSLLIASTAVAVATPGPQTWQLDSEVISTGIYQMEKTGGPGDDGQSGNVNIGYGESLLWIADEAAVTDVTFSSGAWVIELVTDSDWGTNGSNCDLQIGEWDGAVFNPFSTIQQVSASWNQGEKKIVFQVESQTGSETIYTSKYLAVKITNNDDNNTGSHTIYTGEGEEASCLRSPQTDPGYPTPELAAGILLALGLGGLGLYTGLRRKQAVK